MFRWGSLALLIGACVGLGNLDTWLLVQPPDRVRSFSAEAVSVY